MPLFFEDREGAGPLEEDEEGDAATQGREGGASASGRAKEPAAGSKRRAPVWEDEGDAAEGGKKLVDMVKKKTIRKLRKKEDETALTPAEFEARLREHHKKMNPGAAKWAQVPTKKTRERAEWEGSGSDSEGEEAAAGRLTRGFGTVLKKARRVLVLFIWE